jgi:CubicO group peptidase (beta-lactamase class C family)
MKHFAIVLLLLITLPSVSQNLTISSKPEEVGMSSARLEHMDKLLQDYVNTNKVPNAVALIARKGKIIYYKAFGQSNTETKTPVKRDDIFRNASQSKAITSTAVMMLWEEGKFSLDEPISKYIPEFKNPKVLVRLNWADTTYTTEPAKSEITIRQLLTHTSGLDYANIGNQEFKAIYAKAGVPSGIGNDNSTIGEKMKILGGLPLKHHPGEAYTYGLNCDVLGYLVEVLSGVTFDQFLQTRIFKPLGMKDSYFYLPSDKHKRLVAVHRSVNGKYEVIKDKIFDDVNPEYPTLKGNYYSGGAGLNGTIEDYAKFLQMFLNKGEYNGTRFLSRKTIELMLTQQIKLPITNQIGLGFGLETEVNDHLNPESIGSFSWGGAFSTTYWADPKEGLVALVYTNIYASSSHDLRNRFKAITYQAIID